MYRLGTTAARLKLKGIDGPAQAVEDVVQFDATRRTLPGLDMQVVATRKGSDRGLSLEPAQVLHGCRQLVP